MSLSHQVKAWKGGSACLAPGWPAAGLPCACRGICTAVRFLIPGPSTAARPTPGQGSLFKTSTPEELAVSHSTGRAEAAPLTWHPGTGEETAPLTMASLGQIIFWR